MRRVVLCIFLLAALVLLGGCFLEPAESLYAIPAQSADYYNLQSAIEAAMPAGASYSAPVAGENQQPVQMADLDGDGQDEAVVYWKNTGDSPLTVSVFDKVDGQYAQVAAASGAGYGFDRVQYAEIDGSAGYEIVVGRQLSEQVTQTLSVYSLTETGLTELVNTNYSQVLTVDLDGNGCRDVFILHADGDSPNGVAECYRWTDGQLLRDREVRMSTPVTAIKRIITGQMCQGVPAVFAASEYGEGSIITDIFALLDGTLTNFTLSESTDTGVKTVRDYYVYSCDIDADGLIELPRLIPLQALEREESSQNRSLILWYNLHTDGWEMEKCLTYHNYTDGWYLEIPVEWAENLVVTRSVLTDGTAVHRFLLKQAGEPEMLFSLVGLTGENAGSTLAEWGYGLLAEKGEARYGALPGDGPNAPSAEELQKMFHFIRVEWKTGETE